MSEKNDKHFLKSIFSKKDSSTDMRTDETDDYTVERNQKIDVIIRILSIIGYFHMDIRGIHRCGQL